MRLSVRCILLMCYYTSLLTGIMPFTVNFKKGRCEKTMTVTAFSIFANICNIASMPFMFGNLSFTGMGAGLHQIIFGIITLVRVMATVLVYGLNWKNLNELLVTIHGFVHLKQMYFRKLPISTRIQRNFEWNIIWKFTYSLTTEISMWIVAMVAMWEVLSLRYILSTTSLILLTSVLNFIANHYYFGVLFVNAHFSILNDELQRILIDTKSIQSARRHLHSGTFAEVCCQLSDQLDDIAVIYNKLIKLTKNFNNLYQWQAAAICLTLYLSNLSMIFWIYTLIRKSTKLQASTAPLSVSPFGFAIMGIAFVSYYLDFKHLIGSIIRMEVARKESLSILRQQKSFGQLDVRLERSFDAITIQLNTDSLDYNLCGLFTLDKAMVLSIFGSTITHSIFLIQYDMENYSKY